jgi:hypothetical protein
LETDGNDPREAHLPAPTNTTAARPAASQATLVSCRPVAVGKQLHWNIFGRPQTADDTSTSSSTRASWTPSPSEPWSRLHARGGRNGHCRLGIEPVDALPTIPQRRVVTRLADVTSESKDDRLGEIDPPRRMLPRPRA